MITQEHLVTSGR